MQRSLVGVVGVATVLVGLSWSPRPSSAAAADVFIRYEEDAQANWVVTEDCADGSRAQVFVSVIGGLEYQSPDVSAVNEFVNVLIQGSRCDGSFISARGNGAADYQGTPSLRRATVSGSITLNDGSVAAINVQWSGTGRLMTTVNPTRFPGFIGLFRSRERDAEAVGGITLDGAAFLSGPSQSASIRTLEDLNVTFTPPGD